MVIDLIINGLIIGCVYALIAVGLTIIFGVMRIINMCHGDLVMLGMYTSIILYEKYSILPYFSAILMQPFFLIIGTIIYKLIDHIPLKQREMNSLILTLGISFVISTSVMFIFSADYRTVTLPFSQEVLQIGDIRIGYPYVLTSVFAIFIFMIFYYLIMKTKIGRAIRAVAADPDTASTLGIDIKRISFLTYAMGVSLASIAGCIISPILYAYPFVGGIFIIKAFTIVVLGGMGSIQGAFLGGLILGIGESLVSSYFEHSMKDLFAFVVFILFLLFKPTGLFGAKSRV